MTIREEVLAGLLAAREDLRRHARHLRAALVEAEALLGLLHDRCRWGTPGLPDVRHVNAVLRHVRAALGDVS